MTLIDTSVIIDFIAGDKKIIALIGQLAETDDIGATSITEYELLKHKLKLKRQLAEEFIAELTIYPFDSAAAKEAAKTYQELKNAGRMVNENDLLIVGIAMANDEVLLTRDKKLADIHKDNVRIV